MAQTYINNRLLRQLTQMDNIIELSKLLIQTSTYLIIRHPFQETSLQTKNYVLLSS